MIRSARKDKWVPRVIQFCVVFPFIECFNYAGDGRRVRETQLGPDCFERTSFGQACSGPGCPIAARRSVLSERGKLPAPRAAGFGLPALRTERRRAACTEHAGSGRKRPRVSPYGSTRTSSLAFSIRHRITALRNKVDDELAKKLRSELCEMVGRVKPTGDKNNQAAPRRENKDAKFAKHVLFLRVN